MAQSQIITLNGHAYHLRVAGDPQAPMILCLHGFPEYSGAFEDLFPHLADQFFLVAPDQRGYGQSWRPAEVEHYAPAALVADAASILHHYSPNRPAAAVLGHDWGAAIAYGLAFRHADLFARLIIANGVHPIPFQRALAAGGAQSQASQYINWLRAEGSEDKLAEDNHARMMGIFSKHMDMSWMDAPKQAAYRAAWGTAKEVRAMVNWYRASNLKVADPGAPLPPEALPKLPAKALPKLPAKALRVPMPHLLLWGENDTALLPECHAGLEAFCDALTRISISDADHWVLHQKPAEVARHIRAFLR